jgi:hypothetical protein
MKPSKEDLEELEFWGYADSARADLEEAIKTMSKMVRLEQAHRAQFKGAIDWAEDPMVKLRDRMMAVLTCYEVYVDDLGATNGRPAGDYWPEPQEEEE